MIGSRAHLLAILLLAACRPFNSTVDNDTNSSNRLGRAASMANASDHYSTGALDADCAHAGLNPESGVQFIVTCAAESPSPDGRFKLIQGAVREKGEEELYDVYVTDSAGRKIGDVPSLNDGMPFVLIWSSRPGWFLVNHWQGSGLERPRVFEIVGNGVVEHDRFLKVAETVVRMRFPCMPVTKWVWITGSGLCWSKDGRALAWVFNTRPDICMKEGQTGSVPASQRWSPLLMISDVETGAVDPRAVRVIEDGPFRLPKDGLYASF